MRNTTHTVRISWLLGCVVAWMLCARTPMLVCDECDETGNNTRRRVANGLLVVLTGRMGSRKEEKKKNKKKKVRRSIFGAFLPQSRWMSHAYRPTGLEPTGLLIDKPCRPLCSCWPQQDMVNDGRYGNALQPQYLRAWFGGSATRGDSVFSCLLFCRVCS
jgi:hypothetical protein